MKNNPSLNFSLAAIIMSRVLLCILFTFCFFSQYMIPMFTVLFFMMALIFRIFPINIKRTKTVYIVTLVFDKLCQIVVAGCIASKVSVLLPILLVVVLREAFILMGNIVVIKVKRKTPRSNLNDNLLCFAFFFASAFLLFANNFFPASDLLNVLSWLIIAITVIFAVVSFILLYKVFQTEIYEN